MECGLTPTRIVKAWRVTRKQPRSARADFIRMATAARSGGGVEHLVGIVDLDKDNIPTPGIFVYRIVEGALYKSAERVPLGLEIA